MNLNNYNSNKFYKRTDFIFHTYNFMYDFIFFTAPTAQPQNLQAAPISSTELEISWDAPPLAQWNSELLNYKIGYK